MGCKIENSPRQIPGGCDECSLTSPLFTLIPPPWRSIASLFSLNVRELNVQWLDKCFIAMNDFSYDVVLLTFFSLKFSLHFFDIRLVIFQLIIFKFNRDWKLFLPSTIKLSIFGIKFLYEKKNCTSTRSCKVSNESIHGSVKLSPTCRPFASTHSCGSS